MPNIRIQRPLEANILGLIEKYQDFEFEIVVSGKKEERLVARALENCWRNLPRQLKIRYPDSTQIGIKYFFLIAGKGNSTSKSTHITVSYREFVNDWYQQYQDDVHHLNDTKLLRYTANIGWAGRWERFKEYWNRLLLLKLIETFGVLSAIAPIVLMVKYKAPFLSDSPTEIFIPHPNVIAGLFIPFCLWMTSVCVLIATSNFKLEYKERSLKPSKAPEFVPYISEEDYQLSPGHTAVYYLRWALLATLFDVGLFTFGFYYQAITSSKLVHLLVHLVHLLVHIPVSIDVAVLVIVFSFIARKQIRRLLNYVMKTISWIWYDGLSN